MKLTFKNINLPRLIDKYFNNFIRYFKLKIQIKQNLYYYKQMGL